ncbi:hypothetical protein GCM10020295_15310 [Streptomyces cinereospinus]
MSDTTRTVATPDEPIAVIGMSCRLPQADDPAAFWRLLRDGVEAVGETPAHRWDPAALGSADASALSHGAFLDHVDRFDAAFFGIGPAEATAMDPPSSASCSNSPGRRWRTPASSPTGSPAPAPASSSAPSGTTGPA